MEVNAHSLFSKWFSESGKLVTKLFVDLREQLEDEETYLFVLVGLSILFMNLVYQIQRQFNFLCSIPPPQMKSRA